MHRHLRFALLSVASLGLLVTSSLVLLGDSAECNDDQSIASKKITMTVEQNSCGPLGEFSFVTAARDSCVTIEKVEGAEALGLPSTVIPVKERDLKRGFYLGAVERDESGNYFVPKVDSGTSPDTGALVDASASVEDASALDSGGDAVVDAAVAEVVDAALPDAGARVALACVANAQAEDGTWTLDCGTCSAVVRLKN